MSFGSLDMIKALIETNLFGNTWLLGWVVVFAAVIILLICRSYPEVAIMIPLPLIVALAESGIIPFYFKPIVYIMAGVYLAIIVAILAGISRR